MFFDGLLTHLRNVHKKRIPQTFNVVFNRGKFAVFIGKKYAKTNTFLLS